MSRFAFAFLICLGGCAGPHFSLLPSLPSLNPPALHEVAPTPTPPTCPGFILAPIPPRPEFPADAGMVKPKTAAGKAAEDSFLDYVASTGVWGEQGWKVVADAQKFCTNPIKP